MTTSVLPPEPDPARTVQPCRSCGAQLDAEQRYCVSCGSRVGDRTVPRTAILGAAGLGGTPPPPEEPAPPTVVAVPPAQPAPPGGERVQMILLAVLALVLPAFGLGLLLGDRGSDEPSVLAVAPASATTGTAGAAAPVAAFSDTWPAGTNAWTVQLQLLPKASTTPAAVAAARDAATAQGATEIGTLDTDAHPPLPAASYLVYSGVFPERAAADAALERLKASFPQATVVRVGEPEAQAAAEDEESGSAEESGDADAEGDAPTVVSPSDLPSAKKLSPEEFQKQSKKLPKETAIPGKAPPKDDEAPGGEDGGDAVEIG